MSLPPRYCLPQVRVNSRISPRSTVSRHFVIDSLAVAKFDRMSIFGIGAVNSEVQIGRFYLKAKLYSLHGPPAINDLTER